jgi:hypothetical protein
MPIDYWVGLQTVEEYCDALRKYYSDPYYGFNGVSLQRHIVEIQKNLAWAMDHMPSWEGDITDGPYVFHLPDNGYPNFYYAFVWKQRNNGTTFIASQIELPWLRECDVEWEKFQKSIKDGDPHE